MKYLEVKWSVSRGRDTYGYNICTLWDGASKYRTKGGGYDMVGTVLGEWIQSNYQEELKNLVPHATYGKDKPYTTNQEGIYGLSENLDDGSVSLDGACGVNQMLQIAEKIGLEIRHVYGRRNTVGYTPVKGFMVNEQNKDTFVFYP